MELGLGTGTELESGSAGAELEECGGAALDGGGV